MDGNKDADAIRGNKTSQNIYNGSQKTFKIFR